RASSDCATASATGMVRDLSATTTASASASGSAGSAGSAGVLMVCTTRMPARTRLLARSVAPVKSSAMQPSLIAMSAHLPGRQVDAREDLDDGRVVLASQAAGRGLQEHLVGG